MIRNRIITILILLIIVLNGTNDTKDVKAATSSNKKYLVLVEQTEGHWIAYDNLVRISNGKPMVSAEIMARALGYLYETHTNTSSQFVITKTNNVSNTYTIGKKYYNYQSGKTKTKITTKNSVAVTINNLYYCEPESLGKLCYYSYFNGDAIKSYKKYDDIDGVFCFSAVKKTKALPKYNKVYTPLSQLWYKTFVDLNVKERDSTTIYGVTFPRRNHFLEAYETKEDIDGKRFPVYQAMKDKSVEYTEAYRKENNIKVSSNGSFELVVDRNNTFAYLKETYTFFQAFSVQEEKINGEYYWMISMTSQFQPVEADLNALKAICYFISSTPETLYNVITYDLFKFPVVPGMPGLRNARVGDAWIGELSRAYGDFTICVTENMDVNTYTGKDKNIYPSDPFFPTITYYIKKAN